MACYNLLFDNVTEHPGRTVFSCTGVADVSVKRSHQQDIVRSVCRLKQGRKTFDPGLRVLEGTAHTEIPLLLFSSRVRGEDDAEEDSVVSDDKSYIIANILARLDEMSRTHWAKSSSMDK
jgi:hypothetical protein